MRFHLGETMTPVSNLLPLAEAAEKLGFNGYSVSDSLFYPAESRTSYSYTESGSRAFLENKEIAEPFILASAIGTSTSLELTTSVVKLPTRHPVYAAKLACSVAALIKGPLNLGVGLSVWPEDYAVMGIPYEERGKRLDECIEIVRGLMGGGYFGYHGKFYDFEPVKLNPLPPRPVPILIGGHSDAALRRAARNDGWSCAGAPMDNLKRMVNQIKEYRADINAQAPLRIFENDLRQLTWDDVRRKRDAGVTDLILFFRNIYATEADEEPLGAKIDRMRRFSEDVIARMCPSEIASS